MTDKKKSQSGEIVSGFVYVVLAALGLGFGVAATSEFISTVSPGKVHEADKVTAYVAEKLPYQAPCPAFKHEGATYATCADQ